MRKILTYFFAVFFVFSAMTQCSIAQKKSQSNSKKTSVKNLIDSGNFIFQAQSVMPLRGKYRNLTSPYDVTVA